MNFAAALEALQSGKNITRTATAWNDRGLWLNVPDEYRKVGLPYILAYIYVNVPSDEIDSPDVCVPWLASKRDILAIDWRIVE